MIASIPSLRLKLTRSLPDLADKQWTAYLKTYRSLARQQVVQSIANIRPAALNSCEFTVGNRRQ